MKKRVLITGCTSKLGVEISKAFAANNFDVFGHYCSNNILAQSLLEQQIIQNIFQADFSSSSSLTMLLQKVRKILPIDILINNASIFKSDTLHNFSQKKFDEHIHINSLAGIKLIESTASNQDQNVKIINLLDSMLQRGYTKKYFSYYLSKKMLETATLLLQKSFKNVSVNNLYLPEMDNFLKVKDLQRKLLKIAV